MFRTDLPKQIGTLPLWVLSCIFSILCLGGTLSAESTYEANPPSYLACNDQINVSVDEFCDALITVQMVLAGEESYPGFDPLDYVVTVEGFGAAAPTMLVNGAGTYTVSITEVNPPYNTCWGILKVEDKLAPVIGVPTGLDDDPATPEDESMVQDDPATPEDESMVCPCAVGNTLPECQVPGTCLDYQAMLDGDIEMPMPAYFDGCTDNDDILVSYLDQVYPGGNCGPTIIHRTYIFTDASGNKTTSCVSEYTIMPVDIYTDVVPAVASVFLSCGDGTSPAEIYALKHAELLALYLAAATTPAQIAKAKVDAAAHALQYAYPTVNGVALINTVCNTATVSTDLVIYPCGEECGNMKKVIREWNIYDWCSGESVLYPQIIEVQDNDGPSITANDITLSVDPWGCFGAFEFPAPEHLFDACSDKVSYTVTGPAGVNILYNPDQGYYVTNAPKGEHVFFYNGIDCCGNVTSEPVNVSIVDNTAPIAIAKQDIVISLTTGLTGEGLAKIFAFNIDNGSYDGCSDVHLEIRREEDYCGISSNLTYNNDGHPNDKNTDNDNGEFVKFCCADITEGGIDADGDGVNDYANIKVWLRVWDDGDMNGVYGTSGDNYNETWANIRLEDKLTPAINCPPNITIGCEEDYLDLNLTGTASAVASCDALTVDFKDFEKVIDGCGAGYVKRRWSVVSNPSVFCVQTITLAGSAPGAITVLFPDDLDVDCSEDLTDLDTPNWIVGACDQMAWSVDVDTFYFLEDACYKILKKWTVINWCTYDPDEYYSDGIWSHTQIIKVVDDVAPTFSSCADVMFEANDFQDSDNDGIICEANNVMLTHTATDEGDCPSNTISWEIQVDLNGDWVVDYTFSSSVSPLSPYYVKPTASGATVKVTIPGSIPGSMANHRVLWKATDGCGNYKACTNYFMVVDKKAPTPYCTNLSTAFMQNGQVAIWACDFDLGSFDNCSDTEDLRFTFSSTHPSQDPNYIASLNCSSMTFTCDDLPTGPNAGTPIPVTMYVWDEKDNHAFCTVYLTIIDNNGSCDDGTTPSGASRLVEGSISTQNGEMLEDVQINLMSALPEFPINTMTDASGHYGFSNIITNNDYIIEGLKNDDYKNGVSTVDIIMIQRHLLGLNTFNSAYQLIAADANGDEKVTASDMVDIRKLILGINDTYPNSGSWAIFSAAQQLNNSNPWPLETFNSISNLQSNMMNENFIGVKVGDVNNSVEVNAQSNETEMRGNKTITLVYNNEVVNTGDVVSVELSANVSDFSGMQMTLNHAGLDIVSVDSKTVTIDDSYFAAVADGVSAFSLPIATPITLENEVLFTVTFRATSAVSLNEVLSVDSSVVSAEAYTGAELEINTIALQSSETGFALLQNRPNPFSVNTEIAFVLPESGPATLTIFDITGKVAHKVTNQYTQGMNTISVSRAMLSGSGVWFYRLDSGNYSATKKLTVVE